MSIGTQWRRLVRCRSGASAVEFAIVALPLFLVVFGIIEYGRAMWVRQALSETAIASARCMGVLQSECTSNGAYDVERAIDFALETAEGWSVSLTEDNLTLDETASCAGVSGFSLVTIDYRFETAVPRLIEVLSAGIPLSTSACFPNQQP